MGISILKLFLKNVLFTIAFPGVVAVFIPLHLAKELPRGGFLEIPGIFFLIIGAAIYLWCIWDFATFGQGTPIPIDAPIVVEVNFENLKKNRTFWR
ncbi:hypothetical protein HYY75_12450 [bacterium]|nr:hypothetical protein [bacterium]